jgi:transposase
MASSSNSTSPPNPPPSLEQEIHKLKRNLSVHRGFLLRLDGEGGRRFEMLEEDLIQLREEAVEALMYTTQQANGKIAELEARLEKLELQATSSTHQTDVGMKAPLNEGPSNPDHQV